MAENLKVGIHFVASLKCNSKIFLSRTSFPEENQQNLKYLLLPPIFPHTITKKVVGTFFTPLLKLIERDKNNLTKRLRNCCMFMNHDSTFCNQFLVFVILFLDNLAKKC